MTPRQQRIARAVQLVIDSGADGIGTGEVAKSMQMTGPGVGSLLESARVACLVTSVHVRGAWPMWCAPQHAETLRKALQDSLERKARERYERKLLGPELAADRQVRWCDASIPLPFTVNATPSVFHLGAA